MQPISLESQAELIELAYAAMFMRDMRGRIIFWNRGAEQTYGWAKEEALGRVAQELLRTRYPIPLQIIEEVLRERGHWEGELEHTRKDGSRIIVNSRWSLQRDDYGQPDAALEVNLDITEHKRATEHVYRLNQELERRVAERTAELEAANEQLRAAALTLEQRVRERTAELEEANQALRKAQIATAQSEERFRVALLHSPVVVFSQDRDLRYTWVYNPHQDFTVESTIGRTDFELLPPDDAAQLAIIKHRAMETGCGQRGEMRTTVNGQAYYYDLTVEPLRDAEGQVIGVTCASSDITELKQARDQLRQTADILDRRVRERTAELEAILDSLPDAVYIGNDNGIFRCNQAALENLGCRDIEELQDKIPALNEKLENRYADTGEHIRPEDEAFARALRGQPWTYEVTSRNLTTGLDVVQRCAARPVWRDGQVVGAVAINTDITEQKCQEQALRQNEWFLEKAQEVAHVGSWISDPGDSGALTWSKEVYRIFGVEEDAFDGRASTFWSYVHPDDWERVRQAANDALVGIRPYDVDHRIVCPDGTVRWVHEAADVQRDVAGNAIRLIGVVQDITERKEREDALRVAAEVLEQRVQERTAELAAANGELSRSREEMQVLSHRLIEAIEDERRAVARELHDQANQLLTSLIIGLSVLEKRFNNVAGASGQVDYLKQIGNDLSKCMHDLAVSLRPASLDRVGLVPALRQLVELFESQGKVHVELITSDLHGRLGADVETAVYRIVQESLTNVVRHSHGRSAGVIVQRRDGHITAIIEDDGVGFDVAQALCCGRLGLSGMRERAEMLGGRLVIESEPGKGTVIFVEVPVAC